LKNQILNTLYAVGVTSLFRARKKNQLTVLSIHRISDERNTFWNPIRPKTFDLLCQYVKKHYKVIGFDQLSEIDSKSKMPYIILSFDDGYYDFYEFALPILVKHGLPCNHNIVNECANRNTTIWTERLNVLFEHAMKNNISISIDFGDKKTTLSDFDGWMNFYLDTFKTMLEIPLVKRVQIIDSIQEHLQVESNRRMMNWNEIRECAASGTEIGSHSYAHDSIGTITDSGILDREINQSKTEIEAELGRKINVFALPNGQTGSKADEVISKSEYQYVLYANDALNQLPINYGSSPLPINRINLVDEPFPQMALRTEMFHDLLRKYV
jgi:peptidoglycan/xylan/chitin deacetylase (PgdA/CDA1 family)